MGCSEDNGNYIKVITPGASVGMMASSFHMLTICELNAVSG